MRRSPNRCERCKRRCPQTIVRDGDRPGTLVVACTGCGVRTERGFMHAATPGGPACGEAAGRGARTTDQARWVDCAACHQALRTPVPVALAPVKTWCEPCEGWTEHRPAVVLDLAGREMVRLTCPRCTRERRGPVLRHAAAAAGTACGLPADPAVRQVTTDPVAVTCPACQAVTPEAVLPAPNPPTHPPACGSCKAPVTNLKAVVRRNGEWVEARCACGKVWEFDQVRHYLGEPGQTRCGKSLSRRAVVGSLNAAACPECVAAVVAARLGGAPDWRPAHVIAEDYFAA